MKKILLTGMLLGSALTSLMAQSSTTFSYTGAIVRWSVPPCVNSIAIDAKGASGGNSTWSSTVAGGRGANMVGTFSVTPGQTLFILVGQAGESAAVGGGGGGTFVVDSASGQPLIVAGGGGGASSDQSGIAASLTNNGTMDGLNIIAGGTSGNGANACVPPAQNNGGGGGGFLTNGQSANSGVPGFNGGFGGYSYVNGGAGGAPGRTDGACTADAYGGFGGGGGTSCNTVGGGGGGGYSGGAGGPHISQCGAGIRAGGGGGGSYNTGTSPVASVLTVAGDGSVVISYSFTTPPAQPGAIAGVSDTCVGSLLTYSISPVATATSYTWNVPAGSVINSGQGTTSINVTAGSSSGNITVTADNLCGSSSASSFSLTITSLPSVSAIAAFSSVCLGTADTLYASGASTYSWSSGGNNATEIVTPVTTSTYMVTGTDNNGCSASDSITVVVMPLPAVTVSAQFDTLCANNSDTLFAAGASIYSWSTGGNSAYEVIVPAVSGSYTVTGTDTNGCVNSAVISITVNPNPTPNAGPDAGICEGDQITLNGGGGGPVTICLWLPGGPPGGCNPSVFPSATTTYTFTLTDSITGCSASDSMVVTVYPTPVVTAAISDTAICQNEPVVLSASGAFSYTWIPGNYSGTPVNVYPTASTVYTVYATSQFGCSDSATVSVNVSQLPVVSATASTYSVCITDADVTLSGTPAGGTWSGPAITGNSFDPSVAGAGTHSVIYSFTDSAGCSNADTIGIAVSDCVGIAETEVNGSFSVFPVPNNGSFSVVFNSDADNVVIAVTDVTGRIVYNTIMANVNSGNKIEITLSDVTDGIYLIEVISNQSKSSLPVIINR